MDNALCMLYGRMSSLSLEWASAIMCTWNGHSPARRRRPTMMVYLISSCKALAKFIVCNKLCFNIYFLRLHHHHHHSFQLPFRFGHLWCVCACLLAGKRQMKVFCQHFTQCITQAVKCVEWTGTVHQEHERKVCGEVSWHRHTHTNTKPGSESHAIISLIS